MISFNEILSLSSPPPMPELSYDQLISPSPADAINAVVHLAESARNGACAIYSQYPSWILFDPLGGSDPLAQYRKALWDSVCQPSPSPLPPPQPPTAPPFYGGQCDQIAYIVTVRYTDGIGEVVFESYNFWGPITGIALYDAPLPDETFTGISCRGPTNSPPVSPEIININNSYKCGTGHGAEEICDVKITAIVRADGQPDNCGNPPPIPPSPPPESALNFPVQITYNDNSVYSFPAVLNYSPTIINNNPVINNNPNFSFTINVGADPGIGFPGVNFNYNATNISIDLGDTNQSISNNLAIVNSNVSNINNNVNNLSGIVNNKTLNMPVYNAPITNNIYNNIIQPPAQNGEQSDKTDISFVSLTLTQIPANAKIQIIDGSPNIYYCGWFQFSSGGFNFPREQIQFQQSIFVAPPGADGYSFGLYDGFLAQVSEYIRKLDV